MYIYTIKQEQYTMTTHYELADAAACEHVNYIYRNGAPIRNPEKTRAAHRASYLKRTTEDLKKVLKRYEALK